MNTLFAGDLEHLSRRAFLKHASGGLLGLFWLALLDRGAGRERLITPSAAGSVGMQENVPEMGRVLENTVAVYKEPSTSSRLIKLYWRDLVYPIDGVTIGDKKPEYNRVWYRINNEGYVHSGKVQPVAVRTAVPLTSIPERGVLGEICVPFTDARWDPDRPDRFAYRLYYSTTFWITAIKTDKQGKKWYLVPDDKVKKSYYVNAEHLRPLPPEELEPISPQVPAEEKRIEVRLGDQLVIAYEDDKPVFMTRTATGGVFIEGNYTTPTGRFMTNRKRPSRHMSSSDLAAPNSYDLPGVPWVSYLTLKGISFHGTYWHNDFGRPRSHGCLNLSSQAAAWLYRWTLPSVPAQERIWEKDDGTRVDIIE